MSRMGVPSIRSAPETSSTQPSSGSPDALQPHAGQADGVGPEGRAGGEHPHAGVAPAGGRTVGDHLSRTASENCQMSQRWEKSSSPRSASGLRYSGSKTTVARSSSTRPLWRGIPNLVGKSLRMVAMISMGIMACPPVCAGPYPGRRPPAGRGRNGCWPPEWRRSGRRPAPPRP